MRGGARRTICKVSTLGRRVAAIRYAHKLAALPPPTDAEAVKATLGGIRRSIGLAPVKKAPAIVDRIKAMAAACPVTLIDARPGFVNSGARRCVSPFRTRGS